MIPAAVLQLTVTACREVLLLAALQLTMSVVSAPTATAAAAAGSPLLCPTFPAWCLAGPSPSWWAGEAGDSTAITQQPPHVHACVFAPHGMVLIVISHNVCKGHRQCQHTLAPECPR
jgi:hypothetical protein